MDFNNHSIHFVREAYFLKDKPANVAIEYKCESMDNENFLFGQNNPMDTDKHQQSNGNEFEPHHSPSWIKFNNISNSHKFEPDNSNNLHNNTNDINNNFNNLDNNLDDIDNETNNISDNDIEIESLDNYNNNNTFNDDNNSDNNNEINNEYAKYKRPISPDYDNNNNNNELHINKYRIIDQNNIPNNYISNISNNNTNNDSINNNHNISNNFDDNSLNILELNNNNESNTIFSINTEVPFSYNDALKRDDWKEWNNAINKELNNLYNNKVMKFVKNVPNNTNIISTRWVFAIKRDSNNKISVYKARLVAKGYKQKYGIDYDIIYSPTLDIVCIRIILSLAAKFKWNTFQLDIKAAYLNAPLDKEVYVSIPIGDKNYGKGYWLLKKSLYGLKQSGRNWNITFSSFLISIGFYQSKTESCIFFKKDNNRLTCLLGLYVDDIIITGLDYELINSIYKIKNKFSISKCEPINYILGIKVEQDNFNYTISQKAYIENLLSKYNISNTKKCKTPCTGENYKSKNNNLFNKTIYKSAIGSLIHLAKCSRPDISFAVNNAARYCESPTISDWNKIVNIFKYLNYSINYKITYDGSGDIIAFSDADFGGDKIDRKSTSGNIICMGSKPIYWASKKQKSVALSTAEAEFISTTELTRKILWIHNLIFELFNKNKQITIFTDNLSSKKTIENGQFNNNMKHIDLREHFIFDTYKNNKIKLEYIETEKMLADVLTKNVNGTKMTNFTNLIFNK